MRIKSIDILRGITVAAMIMVNNSGGHGSFHPLQHSVWNGLTLCDMVFPTFLFIVGMSTYLSMGKNNFVCDGPALIKILRRSVLIILVGWAIRFIDVVWSGDALEWGQFRLTGVLPRIGVCYFVASILAVTCRRRTIMVIIVGLLAAYGALLLSADGYAADESSVLVRIDRALLGPGHLYAKKPVDPEGVVSTAGAIAHTLIGFCFGSIVADKKEAVGDRLLRIMVWGFVLLLAGLAIEQLLPINKRIWSPSYTLVTCALAALTLGVLGYLTDIKGHTRRFWPFDVFGVNPLFLYALSELTAVALSVYDADATVITALESVISPVNMAALVFSLSFAAVMWLAGLPLYLKKIYIKI